MGDRRSCGRWVAIVGCLVACLAGCAAVTTGPAAPPPSPALPSPTPVARPPAPPVRMVQMNLCGSGIAACYTGRSTDEAAALIRAETPDVITLNEVCDDDVSALEQALADAVPGAAVTSVFQAARNGDSGEPYRCRSGRQYGIGIVSRWPSVPGSAPGGGIYPAQDAEDPEQRAWVCADLAATPPVSVCTTHLAYTERDVALAQCRYLFDTVVAGMRGRDGAPALVLGGDLNLGSGDDPDLRSCLPGGSALVDDGGLQHIVATPEFAVGDSRTIDLRRATDHPGLFVSLVRRPV